MDVKELELQMLIEELESYEGRATELVSYYVPAGYELSKVIEHLGYEYSTAQNIKDKNTRQHVMDAIAKILNYLKGLKILQKMDWLYFVVIYLMFLER